MSLSLLLMSRAAACLFAILAQFGTSVEVHVVSVDVIVTDKSGHRVTGLTKDDFELAEDGKPQAITNFYEVDGGRVLSSSSSPGAPQPRRFVFFLDNDSLQPAVRARLFASLRKFVESGMRDDDQASLIAWNRGLDIAAPLTGDKATLRAALAKAEAASSPLAYQTGGIRARRICQSDYDAARSGRMPVSVAYNDCINSVRVEVAGGEGVKHTLLALVE